MTTHSQTCDSSRDWTPPAGTPNTYGTGDELSPPRQPTSTLEDRRQELLALVDDTLDEAALTVIARELGELWIELDARQRVGR